MSAYVLVMLLEFGGRYATPEIYSPPQTFVSVRACNAFAEQVKQFASNTVTPNGAVRVLWDVSWRCVEVQR